MPTFKFTPPSLNVETSIRRTNDLMTIIKFYNVDELTIEQISDLYGMSIPQVYRILKANGVKMRKKGKRN